MRDSNKKKLKDPMESTVTGKRRDPNRKIATLVSREPGPRCAPIKWSDSESGRAPHFLKEPFHKIATNE